MSRILLAITLFLLSAEVFAQTGSATSPEFADPRKVRQLAKTVMYLKSLSAQCDLPSSEKATLELFAKASIGVAFGHAKVEKADVEIGARKGRLAAEAELAKGPKAAVCEKTSAFVKKLGIAIAEGTTIPSENQSAKGVSAKKPSK